LQQATSGFLPQVSDSDGASSGREQRLAWVTIRMAVRNWPPVSPLLEMEDNTGVDALVAKRR